MATTVGDVTRIEDLIHTLLSLEHDALAAYGIAIEQLEHPEHKNQLTAFREDHLSHLSELEALAAEYRVDGSDTGGPKKVLTSGKIVLAELFGDKAILEAMKTNEDDTVKAYERAHANANAHERCRTLFGEALADEQRHRAWMEDAVDAL